MIVFKEATFLGVILDEHLTWTSHIHNVARKVSNAIGIIYKSSFCLNNSSLRMLYFSLIYPYLFYCVSVWASTYPSNLRRLITLQKRVVRVMLRSAFDARTDPLLKNLKIMNLESIYKLQTGNNSSVVKVAWWVWSLHHTKQFCSNKMMITRETWTSVKL